MGDKQAEKELLTYLSNLRKVNPDAYADLLKIVTSPLSNDAEGIEKITKLQTVAEDRKLKEFESDVGSHTAGKIVEFIILYSLEKLERAKTKSTLIAILKQAGVPAAHNRDFDKVLNARLHRMEKEHLIVKLKRYGTITMELAPAGKTRMHSTANDSSSPLIDEYLKLMLPSTKSAIAEINSRMIDLD